MESEEAALQRGGARTKLKRGKTLHPHKLAAATAAAAAAAAPIQPRRSKRRRLSAIGHRAVRLGDVVDIREAIGDPNKNVIIEEDEDHIIFREADRNEITASIFNPLLSAAARGRELAKGVGEIFSLSVSLITSVFGFSQPENNAPGAEAAREIIAEAEEAAAAAPAAAGAGAAPVQPQVNIPLGENAQKWARIEGDAIDFVAGHMQVTHQPSQLVENAENFYIASIASLFALKCIDMRRMLNTTSDADQCIEVYSGENDYTGENLKEQPCYICGAPFKIYPLIEKDDKASTKKTTVFIANNRKSEPPQCDHVLPVVLASLLFGLYRRHVGRSRPDHPQHAEFMASLREFVYRYACRMCNGIKSSRCLLAYSTAVSARKFVGSTFAIGGLLGLILGAASRFPLQHDQVKTIFDIYKKRLHTNIGTTAANYHARMAAQQSSIKGLLDSIGANITTRATGVDVFTFAEVMISEMLNPVNFTRIARAILYKELRAKGNSGRTPTESAIFRILSALIRAKDPEVKKLLEPKIYTKYIPGRRVNTYKVPTAGRVIKYKRAKKITAGGGIRRRKTYKVKRVSLDKLTPNMFIKYIVNEDTDALWSIHKQAERAAKKMGFEFKKNEMFGIFDTFATELRKAEGRSPLTGEPLPGVTATSVAEEAPANTMAETNRVNAVVPEPNTTLNASATFKNSSASSRDQSSRSPPPSSTTGANTNLLKLNLSAIKPKQTTRKQRKQMVKNIRSGYNAIMGYLGAAGKPTTTTNHWPLENEDAAAIEAAKRRFAMPGFSKGAPPIAATGPGPRFDGGRRHRQTYTRKRRAA